MDSIDFVQFFWLPNTLYRMVGYDFQQLPRPRWRQILMNVFLIFTFTLGTWIRVYIIDQLRRLIASGDILNSFRLAVYVFYAFDSNVKFAVFVLKVQRLRKIYECLAAEYPQTNKEIQLYQVKKYSFGHARLIIRTYMLVVNLIILEPLLQSICTYILDIFRNGYSGTKFPYLHPTPMPYNFDYRRPLYYIPLYMSEYLNSHFCTVTNLGTDTFVCAFAQQICMHLEYLGNSLENYEPSVENSKADCEFLKKWVKKHQLMLNLCAELNEIFGISMLFMIISNCTLYCIIVVQLKLEGIGMTFVKFICFFSVTVIQFFVICQFGQKLITMSEKLAFYAYSNRWYNGSKMYKNMLLTVITRAQDPAKVTAKGFQPISLLTFQIVMTMTYRVFAVLQQALD
ncbi:odorant receptor 49a-like [Eurosta solidaginis]|uniref:odorant receptor 49a-like n=1 Tax=Eurosta solidaginis TaxID=178769 RepID=UPI0035315079